MLSEQFFVSGVPISQGSVSSFKGRIVAVSPALKQWRTAIADEAKKTSWGKLGWIDKPCTLNVVFYLPQPKQPKFWVPAVKPDGDKLLRAVQDALTKVLVRDDCLFIRGTYAKRYGAPGADIIIMEVAE